MSTPDTSSDDATLAAAVEYARKEWRAASDRHHILAAVAIARRLQGEVAAHARCHSDTAGHIDQLEAENRRLRADVHALSKRVAQTNKKD